MFMAQLALGEDEGCDDGEGTMPVWGAKEIDGAFYVDSHRQDGVIDDEEQLPLVNVREPAKPTPTRPSIQGSGTS